MKRAILNAGQTIARVSVLILSGASYAHAQEWPQKPIHLILPNTVASTVDIVARIVAPSLGAQLGQPIVVENRPGTGGVLGATAIAKSPSDGYTMGILSINHVINPSVIKDIPYDTIKDFTPISVLVSSEFALIVSASTPATSVQELIELAKQKPGELTYGSAGNGTIIHLAGAQFADMTGIDVRHVPYRGVAPMMQDLIGGQINFVFTSPATAITGLSQGKLRALAITADTKIPTLPGLPQISKVGVPGFEVLGWMAFVGPPRLPGPIVEKTYDALKVSLADPRTKSALEKAGQEILLRTPAEAQQLMVGEHDRFSKLAAKIGLKAE